MTGRRAYWIGVAVVVTAWLTLWSVALLTRPTVHSLLPGYIAVARVEAAWGVARASRTVSDRADIQRLVSALDTDLAHPIGGPASDHCMLVSDGALVEFWPADSKGSSGHRRPSGHPMIVGAGLCGDIYVVGRVAGGQFNSGAGLALQLPRLSHGDRWTALGDTGNLFAVAQQIAGFTQ